MQNVRKDDTVRSSEPPQARTSRSRVPDLRDVSRNAAPVSSQWRDAASDLATSLIDLAKSDVRLAITEISNASRNAQRHALQMGIFGALAALGILPFLAFLVMGLGDLIDNYWLSALIVSVLCFGIGVMFAYRAWNRIKEQDFSMIETRRMLDRQIHTLQRKLTETSQQSTQTDRRAA